jgi:beta-galactosidase
MHRTIISLNTDWLYTPHDRPAAANPACDESAFVPVSIPHTNFELPHHNFSEQEYCFVSWYRKRVVIPADAAGRRVFLDFDGVMVAATVYVNGKPAGPEHRGGFTPFSLDVTDLVKPGEENLLAVRVDSAERPEIPPFGGVVDYLAFGGIYRDVALRIVDPIYIKDIFAVPKDVLSDRKSVDISATIVNTTDEELEVDLTASIGGGAASISGDLELPPRGEAKITFGLPGLEAELWDLDHPTLYEAAVELDNGDRLTTRVGFRTIEFNSGCGFQPQGNSSGRTPLPHEFNSGCGFQPQLNSSGKMPVPPEFNSGCGFQPQLNSSGKMPLPLEFNSGCGFQPQLNSSGKMPLPLEFRLNGKPIKLRGLNRHQTFPYIGAAAPARLQVRDALILKYDLACNIVRTSHYPQSRHFLDACDEIGLLVFEEIPGWQFIGDETWQELSLRDVEAMIVRDRNRPSVVLWGVRINESRDDHDFYTRTNELARKLDPSRPTGGVRNFAGSELLEDVYTMNDFEWALDAKLAASYDRYLNTEYCGPMVPAKSFDCEERVRQHALAHAGIVNQIAGTNSAGGIGWCAFDYNTHAMFGSGDRICYHGVMDIFREPKFAAHFYAAFVDPEQRIVLEPATYWKRGDQSGGGIEPLVVFGNVDEIEVLLGDDPPKSCGRFKPRRDLYPGLTRPPFIVEDVGSQPGHVWPTLTVVGYIRGEPVATRKIAADGLPKQLIIAADDDELDADGADMTRIALRICDEFGNVLPFAMQPVSLQIEGPGTLVGENPFPMPGGRGAVYVRAARTPGTIKVTATTPRLAEQSVTILTIRS